MEAEARAILTAVVSDSAVVESPSSLPEWVDRLYGKHKPKRVVDALIAERRREPPQVTVDASALLAFLFREKATNGWPPSWRTPAFRR